LFGSGFGQDASTAKVGMSPARDGEKRADTPISARPARMLLEKMMAAGFERA
jgi:hypothetical protein